MEAEQDYVAYVAYFIFSSTTHCSELLLTTPYSQFSVPVVTAHSAVKKKRKFQTILSTMQSILGETQVSSYMCQTEV